MQENQNQIVQAIEFDPKKAITYEGEPLPSLEDVYDEDGEEIEDAEKEVEVKKPTKSVKIFNLDKGINDEYKELLSNKSLELPSIILNKNVDVDDMIKKVQSKIKRSEDYIKDHMTKTGLPRAKLTNIKKTTLKKNQTELKYYEDYLMRLKDIKKAPMYLGEGIYTQKKRNAYKVNKNGKYGNLIIDLPKLFGQLKVIVHMNNKKIYDKQADFDTIDLLTKRFNSKKKYSDLSKMIFNELNTLSQIPIHRTSNKYKRLGSGVVYYNNPDDLIN